MEMFGSVSALSSYFTSGQNSAPRRKGNTDTTNILKSSASASLNKIHTLTKEAYILGAQKSRCILMTTNLTNAVSTLQFSWRVYISSR